MDAQQLRRAFTGFFVERGHTLVPSAGLIPHHPAAPLFTNAGMNQFLPYPPRRGAAARTPGPRRCRSASASRASTTTSSSGAPPATSASSRCSATSASATTSRTRPSRWPGSWSPRCWASTATGCGSPSTSTTTRPRPSGATRSACRPERIQRMGDDNFWEMGEGSRPVRPVLGDLLRQGRGVRRGGRARPAAATSATSRSGTSCSCSTTARPTASLLELPTQEHRHRCRPRAHPAVAPGRVDRLRHRRAPAGARRRRRACSAGRYGDDPKVDVACASSPTTPAP